MMLEGLIRVLHGQKVNSECKESLGMQLNPIVSQRSGKALDSVCTMVSKSSLYHS